MIKTTTPVWHGGGRQLRSLKTHHQSTAVRLQLLHRAVTTELLVLQTQQTQVTYCKAGSNVTALSEWLHIDDTFGFKVSLHIARSASCCRFAMIRRNHCCTSRSELSHMLQYSSQFPRFVLHGHAKQIVCPSQGCDSQDNPSCTCSEG